MDGLRKEARQGDLSPNGTTSFAGGGSRSQLVQDGSVLGPDRGAANRSVGTDRVRAFTGSAVLPSRRATRTIVLLSFIVPVERPCLAGCVGFVRSGWIGFAFQWCPGARGMLARPLSPAGW